MFRKLIGTTDDFGVMVVRVALGAVMFPHGAQKVLGWFGGYGFGPTLDAFVTQMGIPVPLALLAFAAEFLGGLGLIVGLLGRVAAFGVLSVMVVAATTHLQNGFFMNWAGNQGGEGYEFHILAMAMAAAVIVRGSGALSLDRLLSRGSRPGRTVALPRAA